MVCWEQFIVSYWTTSCKNSCCLPAFCPGISPISTTQMYRWCIECATSIRIFVVFSFLLREGIYSGVLNPNSPFSLHLTFAAVKSPDIPIPTIPQHQTHAIFLLRPPFCHNIGATSPLCCQNPKFCRVLRRCFGRLPTHSYVRRYGMRTVGRHTVAESLGQVDRESARDSSIDIMERKSSLNIQPRFSLSLLRDEK